MICFYASLNMQVWTSWCGQCVLGLCWKEECYLPLPCWLSQGFVVPAVSSPRGMWLSPETKRSGVSTGTGVRRPGSPVSAAGEGLALALMSKTYSATCLLRISGVHGLAFSGPLPSLVCLTRDALCAHAMCVPGAPPRHAELGREPRAARLLALRPA